ncbi:hypothetical protein L7F22_026787 [Adiantum nelumboides]|nr:hypothetical protein [Adiantum nelumboides]
MATSIVHLDVDPKAFALPRKYKREADPKCIWLWGCSKKEKLVDASKQPGHLIESSSPNHDAVAFGNYGFGVRDALTIVNRVGKAALSMVKMVCKHFNTILGLMKGITKLDYATYVKISTNASIKAMSPVGALVMITPWLWESCLEWRP